MYLPMENTASSAFTHSSCQLNTSGDRPIMAVYRMQGNKVVYSIGVLLNGSAIHINKLTGEKSEYDAASTEAKASRRQVKEEWGNQNIDIPPLFVLTLSL